MKRIVLSLFLAVLLLSCGDDDDPSGLYIVRSACFIIGLAQYPLAAVAHDRDAELFRGGDADTVDPRF